MKRVTHDLVGTGIEVSAMTGGHVVYFYGPEGQMFTVAGDRIDDLIQSLQDLQMVVA